MASQYWMFNEVERGTPTTLGYLYRYEDRIDREGRDDHEYVTHAYGKILLVKVFIQRITPKGYWIQADKFSNKLRWIGHNNTRFSHDPDIAKKDFLRRKQAVLEIAQRRASTARQMWCAAADEWGFNSNQHKLLTVGEVYAPDDPHVRNLPIDDIIPFE